LVEHNDNYFGGKKGHNGESKDNLYAWGLSKVGNMLICARSCGLPQWNIILGL